MSTQQFSNNWGKIFVESVEKKVYFYKIHDFHVEADT